MRVTRVEKFKKNRHRKNRNLFMFTVVFPCLCILLGYIITSVVILPAMTK